MSLGCSLIVLLAVEVMLDPEHAVTVEQSVTRPCVTVPDMIAVPWKLVMAAALHELLLLLLDDVNVAVKDEDGSSSGSSSRSSGSAGWCSPGKPESYQT